MFSKRFNCRGKNTLDVVGSCSLQMWHGQLMLTADVIWVANSCSLQMWRGQLMLTADVVWPAHAPDDMSFSPYQTAFFLQPQTKVSLLCFSVRYFLQPWVNNTYPISKVSQPFTEGTVPLPFLDPLDLGAGCGQEENVNYMHPQCESIFDLSVVIQEDFSWGANKTMHTLN